MPMSSSTIIPRFLLPQRSIIWRSTNLKRTKHPRRSSTSPFSTTARSLAPAANRAPSSSSSASKPLVLERPTKFVPPSHGAKLRKEPPKYPGVDLSAEEKARQQTKQYPNMMPPKGTLLHWFLNNRSIHVYIALSTLFTMAATVFITNFKRTSPFADMLPHWSQLFVHPIQFSRTVTEVLRLHQAHATAETQERRKRKVEDVAKRSAYRKAHGLESSGAFGGWTAKTDSELLGPAIPLRDADAAADGEKSEVAQRERKPVKKWLGIW